MNPRSSPLNPSSRRRPGHQRKAGRCRQHRPATTTENRKAPVMIHRKLTASLAAAAALLTLGACGSAVEGQAQQQPQAATSTPAPQPPAAEPDALPLPTTDTGGIFDQAYLDTLAEEGITLDKQTALDAADVACDGDGLMDSINRVMTATGLTRNDAAYLVGAALVTCGVR